MPCTTEVWNDSSEVSSESGISGNVQTFFFGWLKILGGGNSDIFIFTPKIGEHEPILSNIFQGGWNHQLVTRCFGGGSWKFFGPSKKPCHGNLNGIFTYMKTMENQPIM